VMVWKFTLWWREAFGIEQILWCMEGLFFIRVLWWMGQWRVFQQFLKAQVSGVEADNSAAQAKVIKWNNPPSNTYKANWDMAVDSKSKKMGIGVVIRECHCSTLPASRELIRPSHW
jgi:hypothetical protein